VLLGSHLGNMEVCCALAELRPQLRLNVLVHTQHAEQFNLLLDKVRNGPRKVELIQVTQLTPATAMLLNQRIEAGEFVAIVADRTPVAASDRFVTAPFLGREAPFPQGPFILAALLQCPVYSLMCPYRNGRYEISAELFAEKIVLPRRDRLGAIQAYAAQFSRLLEDHCRRAPLQWFNFYPFWNGTNAQP
jgi:predicted LPLAT superfamily acyltransferase